MSMKISAAEAAGAAPVENLAGRRLTLLLHGLGADERDLLSLAPAFGDDVVISLRAPVPYGPGFSWAVISPDSIPGRGTGLGASADAVLEWLDGLAARSGLPSEVRLLGFSQGGALALALLRRAPGRFGRIVVLAGFVPAEAAVGDTALAADPSAPVFWGRGDADAVIAADAIARTEAWLPAHAAATIRVYPGLGHGIADAELADVVAFLR